MSPTDREVNERMKHVERESHRFNAWMTLLVMCFMLYVICMPLLARAEVKDLQLEVPYNGGIYICKTLEDAVDVITVEVTDSLEKAQEVFEKKVTEGKCIPAEVIFVPRKLAATAKGKHGTKWVIDVAVQGGRYFMLSDLPLVPKKGKAV